MTGSEDNQDTEADHETTEAGGPFPVLPLRDIVVFPHMVVPLFVGREKSIRALEEVMRADNQILLVTQKEAGDDDPKPDGLYEIGTLATVLQLLKLPDGTVKVLVEGASRATVSHFTERTDYFEADVEGVEEPEFDATEAQALSRSVISEFENYVKLNKKISPEVISAVSQIEDHSKLADTIASHLVVKIPSKQEILATASVIDRFEKVLGIMNGEISVLQVEKRIRSRVKRQMEKTQREYYLNEQMRAIQKELGDGEDGKDELAELEERIKNTKFTRKRVRRRRRSSRSCVRCHPCQPRQRLCATTSTGCCRFPGRSRAARRSTLATPKTCSTPITTGSRR